MKKINIEVRRYLERELRDYEENKKYLEELKNDIIDSSPSTDLRHAKIARQGGNTNRKSIQIKHKRKNKKIGKIVLFYTESAERLE